MATTTFSSPPAASLVAQYTNTSSTSPSEPFAFTSPLPALSSTATAPPTTYLHALRIAITSTQTQINEALTTRMEEDKRRDAEAALAAGGDVAGGRSGKSDKRKKGKTEIDEEAEELNYGEEIVEED
ncbi:putative EKC/KEOPS complex subunit GON7 [Seiridium cardinale]|uniref:EKC/KEOPS complex subunit GON7 n=1 Tax=Seiridium cardinale TaxID=138064 RepID=A0ABR2XQC4_9PEZI